MTLPNRTNTQHREKKKSVHESSQATSLYAFLFKPQLVCVCEEGKTNIHPGNSIIHLDS